MVISSQSAQVSHANVSSHYVPQPGPLIKTIVMEKSGYGMEERRSTSGSTKAVAAISFCSITGWQFISGNNGAASILLDDQSDEEHRRQEADDENARKEPVKQR